jgi:hypothetical protein
MSESLYQSRQYENSLTEIDHLNRFRHPDGRQNPFAIDGVYKNLVPATKEAGIIHAVSTTYQEYGNGEYWWLDQTPEDVARSGYLFHQHPSALERVDIEVEEARNTKNLQKGRIKVLISPRMSPKDAPYEVAKREHLADEDMIRIHMVDMGENGEPRGKYMQSLLVQHIPLSAWVRMLRDPQNIFGRAIAIEDEDSALSVMKVHKELELPEAALPEGVVSLVEAVLPYVDATSRPIVERQLLMFRGDQASLHTKAENIASRWLSFEVALADSLYGGYATDEIQSFIRNLAFEWNDEITAEIMQNTDHFGRVRMTRSLAAKLEISRQNTLWVSAGVITNNERILAQLSPAVAQAIYVNEMFLQTMMADGASSQDIRHVESQNSKVIAGQNVTAGGGCPGSGKGLFGSSSNPTKQTGETADKKCPEVKNGQSVRCPGCKEIVKAIVPNKDKIYCSNAACKLAAPNLKSKQADPGNRQESVQPPREQNIPERSRAAKTIESTAEIEQQTKLQKAKQSAGELAMAGTS